MLHMLTLTHLPASVAVRIYNGLRPLSQRLINSRYGVNFGTKCWSQIVVCHGHVYYAPMSTGEQRAQPPIRGASNVRPQPPTCFLDQVKNGMKPGLGGPIATSILL